MNVVLLGIIAFIPILLILVIIHEFGHYITAKLFKVHVHEFGFGFFIPLFKFYTGKTVVTCNDKFIFQLIDNAYQNKEIVKLPVYEDVDGNLIATNSINNNNINRKQFLSNKVLSKLKLNKEKRNLQLPSSSNDLVLEGIIKEAKDNKIIISSMAWSVNLIPLGGFVRLAGENNNHMPRSLKKIHQWKQSIILVSGSAVNLLFPIIIAFIFLIVPHPIEKNGNFIIKDVISDSYAETIGFQVNDIIISINDIAVDNLSTYHLINDSKQLSSEWIIQRNEDYHTIVTNPVETYGIKTVFVVSSIEYGSENPLKALQTTADKAKEITLVTSKEIYNWTTRESDPEVMGPIGMVNITSQMTRNAGIIGWGLILIIISINLGIINLLPIPSLDGGRLVFVIIEWIRGGKQLPERVEGTIHSISFVVLISIIILVSMNDIHRILK